MRFLKNRLNGASDEQLMSAIQNGSSHSLEELYNRYNRRILIYFYRMLGEEEKAQDFLQDIFLKIIEHPQSFDTNRKFVKWVFSIAANMCKNEYRYLEVRKNAHNGKMNDMELTTELEMENELDHAQFKMQLSREIRELDADQRNTFLLRFQENFSIRDISQILKCSEGTIKSRLHYITRKLAIKLKDFDPLTEKVSYHENQK
jgi:RNA polymerase sigma-70 factor (ECF subfamily)